MSNSQPVSLLSRALKVAALVAFGLGLSSFAFAETSTATVVSIQPTRVADLVLLDHGFDAGLRQGMVCRVTRANAEIAEILLVELRPTCSAALIVAQTPKQSIRSGDVARIKILKT